MFRISSDQSEDDVGAEAEKDEVCARAMPVACKEKQVASSFCVQRRRMHKEHWREE